MRQSLAAATLWAQDNQPRNRDQVTLMANKKDGGAQVPKDISQTLSHPREGQFRTSVKCTDRTWSDT